MENVEALKWAGLHTGLAVVATLVALGIAGLGAAIGGLRLLGMFGYAWFAQSIGIYPRAGLALIVLGGIVWWYGVAGAFIKTIVEATEAETADTMDTEAMKSDILAVLDDRLADMQQEVNQTRRLVDRLSRDDAASEFEFSDDF